jgi:hypothetical protein
MPATAKGPRLWLRKARRDEHGRITHGGVWIILDGKHQESTECDTDDRGGAERALEAYLDRKHTAEAKKGVRDPSQIPVADVLALYASDVVPGHARPHETAQRIERLLAFFGSKTISAIDGDLCRAYIKSRSTEAAARRDLEELRAAINYHRQEGRCDKIVSGRAVSALGPRRRCRPPAVASGFSLMSFVKHRTHDWDVLHAPA